MKRFFTVIAIILLLFTGCGKPTDNNVAVGAGVYNNEKEHESINIPYPQNTNELLEGEQVEDNINAGQLSEDNQLTKEAQEKKVTESDVIVNKDDLRNLEAYKENILKTFKSELPDEVTMNLKYNKYEVPTDYVLILSDEINIREKPFTAAKSIGKAQYFEKVNLIAEVKGEYLEKYKTDKWYKVAFKQGDKVLNGYILSVLARQREFQFEAVYEAVYSAKDEVDNSICAYITNYKNRTGTAPLYNGGTKDKFGIQRNQSAPAYYEPNLGAGFRYISDGTIVSILAETDSFYKISTLSFKGEYYVPKKYISFANAIKNLTKVVVVDRKNQNECVLEYVNGKWNLISFIYATTGENSKNKLPTDLGYYTVMQKVPRFSYLKDGTNIIAGYAPYGIRFNGGAYIHGVPVDYVKKSGKNVDPGLKEYLFTVGTIPKSHKCVRNYTSHAKFLYDWVEIGKSAVIVIE